MEWTPPSNGVISARKKRTQGAFDQRRRRPWNRLAQIFPVVFGHQIPEFTLAYWKILAIRFPQTMNSPGLRLPIDIGLPPI